MNGGHWTEQDFIDHVYGLGTAGRHLETCAVCRQRWAEVSARRESIIHEPEAPPDFLAQQRRNIYRRLGRKPRPGVARIVPAFAAALLLIVGSFYIGQAPQAPAPSATPVSDAQLFSEIYALEQSSEPHVGKPMRALFQEN